MTDIRTPDDPSDSSERVEAALKPWGWTCGDDFWRRYHQDAWVFNLVNALTRITAEVERLRVENTTARSVIRRMRAGWRPGDRMQVVEVGSPRPEPVRVWMNPNMRVDSEPMTDAERSLLADAARPTKEAE